MPETGNSQVGSLNNEPCHFSWSQTREKYCSISIVDGTASVGIVTLKSEGDHDSEGEADQASKLHQYSFRI